MKRLLLLASIAIAGFCVYTAIFSATVRYRLTLYAEVHGEPKSGSGVIEVAYNKNNDPISQAEFSIGIRGEAVVLDLGSRGILFALLKGDTDSRSGPEYILFRAFDFPYGAFPDPVMTGLTKVRQLSGKRELPLTSLPLLVRFRDLKDPKSVERVDPRDIGKSFGADAKLVRATLEIVPAGIWPFSFYGITGEPVTSGIDERLLWLPKLKGGYLDGGFTSKDAPLGLYGGNFKSG